ncbi:S-layer homology domain-containing protein [Cohnella hashimotonis]|uniref:S-layer homology domain-containing protein n=1 Tax=Cohnella hashimotonis TaxID=2826895 RepID=A0ABT6TB30_9BACL|nr:S-layer homology domain-containing protein [Cohnella hashimotonis]MDI4644047.1 S-layer homology domain-containing protein [Cohnella hashimotonis]
MSSWRKWLAACMTALLMLTSMPAFAAENAQQEPHRMQEADAGGAGVTAPAYIRIKNKWQSNYLYEGSDGTVRYGRTALDDASSQWRLEPAAGGTRIQNRATGHYITIAETAKRRDALVAREIGVSTAADQWLIEDASRPGYKVIKSATADASANLVIHEEDQLGYAEASNDINITFESPQWMFEPAETLQPVLIANEFRAGQFLYETANPEEGRARNVVAFGKIDPTDPKAHWYVEVESGEAGAAQTVRLRNRATGDYIEQFDADNYWRRIETAPASSAGAQRWTIASAAAENGDPVPGFVSIASADHPAFVLNTQFEDTYARSNDWSNAGRSNAHWKIAPAYDVKPVRIVNYTAADAGTDYLYEGDGGLLKHGALAAGGENDPAYQWIVEDQDGKKRIRNAASGSYLASGDPLAVSPAGSVTSAVYQWQLSPSEMYDDYVNIAAADGSGLLLLQGGVLRTGASDPDTDAAQWLFEDPAARTDGSPQYVRIQNEWKPYVWYEDDHGDLKYGNPRTDGRDQWLIEKYQGRKRIQNRATGHYVNLQNMTDGHIRVTAVSDGWTSAVWVVESLAGGSKLIYNVADRVKNQEVQKLVNLQNLNKYAEYAEINRNWGSPHWTLIPVDDAGPSHLRFTNKQGQSLYEETEGDAAGKVRYGEATDADLRAVWYVEDAGGEAKRLKNVETGHYIAMENMAGHESEDAPDIPLGTEAVVYESWGSAKWYLEAASGSGYTAIRSGWAGHYIYADGAGGTKVSKTVKSGGDFADEALFKAEPVELKPEVPEGYIRIQNEANGQYLYENLGGVVLYGSIAENNGYGHWRLVRQDGAIRIENRATGHLMTLTPDYRYIESLPASDAANEAANWSIEASASSAGHWLIRNLSGGYDDEFVHTDNAAGYAERGLVPVSFGTARWSFAAAPADYETPDDDGAANTDTATPVFDDTAYTRIGSGGVWLADRDGTIALANESGAAAQWLLQDFNGRKLLKNRASGRLLALDQAGQPIAAAEGTRGQATSQWEVVETQGLLELRSAADRAGMLLHASGAAEYGGAANAAQGRWNYERLPGDVVYEAENAFMGGGVAANRDLSGYTGDGYASGWAAGTENANGATGTSDPERAHAKLTFTVHAQSAGDYDAIVRYAAPGASVSSTLGVAVNGLSTNAISLLPTGAGWSTAALRLTLRQGLNTIALQPADAGAGAGQTAALAVDSLTLKNSVAPAYRGATTPYATYEAEDAETNGELLRASRSYYNPASEASGRRAVKLSETGDYVSFTLAHPANSIVLRYSIPDSQDGAGRTETLGLYVNGQFRQKLTLTSKYAWEYGSYPWSNDPTQGSGHRFFDDVHTLIGDVPAGAKIMLKKDAESTSPFYTIDLADFEQAAAPLRMPEGFLSVDDYGAAPDDGIDDTAAFKRTMDAAKNEGKGVWFPAGEYELRDGLLNLDRIQIRGAGMWHTQLTGAKFVGRGDDIGVYDLLIDGDINVRDDEAITNAFHGGFGPGSVLQNVWIEHTKAGLWLTKVKDGEAYTHGLHMVGLRMRNLMADGINFSVGTKDSMLEQSDVRYPGDDGIAMWSTDGLSSVNNTARFNTVSLPWLANNIAVFGGTDNRIQDNVAKDTIINGSGITVSTRFNPLPFAGMTVVERNTLIRTGSYDTGLQTNLGAIWLFADTKNMTGDIVIRDNTAMDSTYAGVVVNGTQAVKGGRLLLQNLVLDGAGTAGVQVAQAVTGAAEIDNVIVRGAKIADVSNASAGFVLREVNAGFASAAKPFAATAEGGALNGFVLTAGASLAIKVADAAGKDVTAQSTFATEQASVAAVDAAGMLSGIAKGETRLRIAYDGAERTYTVKVVSAQVVNPPATGGGGNGGTAGSMLDAAAAANDAKLKAATGEAIAIAASADGTAPFTAQALLAAAADHADAVLTIASGDSTYRFPLSLAAKLIKARGYDQDPKALWIFEIKPLEDTSLAPIREAAKRQHLELVAAPVEFAIILRSGGKTETIADFGGVYVDRTLKTANRLDEASVTAVVYRQDQDGTGTFVYVPALFRAGEDGGTIVTIRSPGNSVYAVASHTAKFADLANHWAKQEIERMASKLIVKGVGGDAFGPSRSITRAEFAALLVRGLGLRDPGGDDGFEDVAGSAWYASEVRTAASYGLVRGFEDGSFRPQATVTREEIAVMVAQALKLAGVSDLTGTGAGAVAQAAFADAVRTAAALGIVKGLPDGRFAPRATATRAEAVAMLSRTLQAAGLSNAAD